LIAPLRQNIDFALKLNMPDCGCADYKPEWETLWLLFFGSDGLLMRKRLRILAGLSSPQFESDAS